MTPASSVTAAPPAAMPPASAQAWTSVQAQALAAVARQQGWPMAIKHADDGRYVVVNEAFAALLARAMDEVVGRHDGELFDAASAAVLKAADQTALRQAPLQEGVTGGEQRLDIGGVRREFHVLRSVYAQGGRGVLLTLWQDLAPQRVRDQQLRQALEQLEQHQHANDQLRREMVEHSLRDQSSGLNNKAQFDDQLRRELDLSVREHREFALVHMALDPFKPEVAAHGEVALDRISEAMGRLLRGNTRVMDACCRVDDRHFAVLLSGVGLATAHARMEGLRRQCATQIVMWRGERLPFSVSMGIASFPHTAQTADSLVQACQAALQLAQRRSGNNVALATIRFQPK